MLLLSIWSSHLRSYLDSTYASLCAIKLNLFYSCFVLRLKFNCLIYQHISLEQITLSLFESGANHINLLLDSIIPFHRPIQLLLHRIQASPNLTRFEGHHFHHPVLLVSFFLFLCFNWYFNWFFYFQSLVIVSSSYRQSSSTHPRLH